MVIRENVASADRQASAEWARKLLADPSTWCIFDTETTGLNCAEILQVGLLLPDGTAAMDSLVLPDLTGIYLARIPSDATAVHGITDKMVQGAPTLDDLLPEMAAIMHGRTVVVYNANYDMRILRSCIERRHGPEVAEAWIDQASWECAMLQYAKWFGEWDHRRSSYRWQRLQGGDHSAIGDCRATLDVIRRMAGDE